MPEPLLVRAARLEPTERTPVWFMRQAGRSLPEYREIRKTHTLFEVCHEPELCAEVTLQPVRRHDVDAAVMFADIMLPLLGDGRRRRARRERRPRDRAADPLAGGRRAADRPEPEESVPFILEAISLVRRELRPDQAVIGFCGGPVHGRRLPRRGQAEPRVPEREAPDVRRAADLARADGEADRRRSRATSARQVEAGADVIQLFDSWVGALSPADYEEFVQPYSARILAAVDVPDDPLRHRHGDAARADARRRRRRDRARLADPARLGLERGRRGPRRPGEPRRRAAARPAGSGSRRRRSTCSRAPPAGRATSSTSATASCPTPTRTCSAGCASFVHEQTARVPA